MCVNLFGMSYRALRFWWLGRHPGATLFPYRRSSDLAPTRRHSGEKDPVSLALVVQGRERRLAELSGDLLGRRHDGGAEGRRRHHVHRAREAVPPQHLARGRHHQEQARAGFLHELDQRLQGPGFDRAGRHATTAAARSSSRRTRPTFTSGSATATTRIPEGAPTTSSAPCAACRCQNTPAPSPAASRARPSRLATLPASAATAAPLIPSISCSATTIPSSAETSIAPRTPRTRVTRSSAWL